MSSKKWFNSVFRGKKVIPMLAAALVLTTTAGIASACGGSGDKPESSSTAPVEVKYTVTFNSVGGSTVEAVTVKEGGKVAQPADPTRVGFKFAGWYTDENYTTKFHFTEAIKGDVTLYARWIDINMESTAYTLSFDLNYEGKKLADQETIAGLAIDLPIPERAGHTFGGWWVSMYDDADKLSYECVEEMAVKENLTLYALWIPEEGKEIVADVQGDKIVWDAVEGVDRYHIEITGPDGFKSVYRQTSLTSWDVDFANQPAGEYVIKVSSDRGAAATTAVRYYKNKALARVSNFQVVDGTFLAFNGVENAQEYLVHVECANPAHKHEFSTIGEMNGYDFSACEMAEDGIKFTVKAVGDGFVESISKPYVLNRTLNAVTGLKVNEAEQAVWNAVEGATEYELKIKVGSTTETIVTTATSYDLRGYAAGKVYVAVTPASRTYHSSKSASIEYTKTSPAVPVTIVMNGNQLTWDATDAEKYYVYIADKKYETATNSFALVEGTHYQANAKAIDVKVVAVGATESQASDTYSIGIKEITGVAYAQNTITWSPVVGAEGYQIQVNGGATVRVNANTTSTKVTLTQKENVITVAALVGGKYTTAKACDVYAHAVSFEVGGGDPVDTQYLATGDVLELPKTYQSGYDNNGWFTAPHGAELGAWNYEDVCIFNGVRDTVIYASWTGKKYTVSYNYVDADDKHVDIANKKENIEIAYDEGFVFDAPVSKDESYVFTGWYSEPNGAGVKYTNEKGIAYNAWSVPNNATVYAHWAKVFEFVKQTDGTYAVKAGADLNKYADSITEITIPSTYMDVKVTVVSGEAFSRCKKLEIINIPNTIETIETDSAFDYCNSLREVNIYEVDGYTGETFWASSDGVLIKLDAITNESILKFVPRMKTGSFTIPDAVTEIPTALFADWLRDSYIEELVIPASVKTIQTEAFYNCKYLQSVRFLPAAEGQEANVTIAERAFKSCYALEEIHLPAHLSNMSLDMFEGCSALSAIHVEEGNAAYSSSKDGSLLSPDGTTLVMVPTAKTGVYTIPEGVTKIDQYAFNGCKDITEIVIPWWVTEIAEKAFVGYEKKKTNNYAIEEIALEGITKVTFKGGAVSEQTIAANAFKGLETLTTVVFEDDVKIVSIGANAFAGTGITEIIIPASVTSISEYAFADSALSKLTFNEGETLSLGSNAFANTALKTVTLPASVNAFQGAVFAGCNALEAVEVVETNATYKDIEGVLFTKDESEILFYPVGRKDAKYALPENVATIGASVFQNNQYITEITIGEKVVTIGANAFDGCANLTLVDISTEGEALSIGAYAFANCIRLTDIELPARVGELSNYMFYASGLTTIDIKGAITSIPTYAFAATNVSEIELPATVTSIGTYAFAATPIVDFEIPAKVTSISSGIFANCVNLNKVTFAAGTTISNIPANAFQKSNLREIVIPATVTKINNYAFDEATMLHTVTFEGTSKLSHIGSYAFRKCYSLTSFDLPDSVQYIAASTSSTAASYSFQYCYNLKTFNIGDASKLKIVGTYAFQYSGITSFKIAKTMTRIGNYAFSTTGSLKTVTSVPGATASLTLGTFVFNNSSVEEINFSNKLSTVTTATTYGGTYFNQQFAGCKNLKAINVEEGGTKFASVDGILYNNTKTILWQCPEGKKGAVTIPNTVTTVKGMAFRDCTKITSVTFEELAEDATGSLALGETSIKDPSLSSASADKGRPNFSAVQSNNGAFVGCTSLASVTLPKHLTYIGKMAFANNASLKTITIPENVTKIDNYAFTYAGLESITFEGTSKLAYIGIQAFALTNLKSIEIPAAVTEIADKAFDASANLATVTFAEGAQLASIGVSAFENTALTKFTLPATLTEVKDKAFAGTAITSFAIPANLNEIKPMLNGISLNTLTIDDAHALYYVKDGIVYDKSTNNFQLILASVEELRIADGTTALPERAFANLTLKKVIIPASVTQIGTNAFEFAHIDEVVFLPGNDDLVMPNAFMDSYVKRVTIPARVTNLGNNAFYRAREMQSIVFEKGSRITEFETRISHQNEYTMGANAFYGLINLTELVLPDRLTGTLPNFRGLNKLEKLVIPEGITTIAKLTFWETATYNGYADPNRATEYEDYGYACDNLKEIVLPSTLTTIADDAFFGCTGLEKITIPASVTEFGSGAFSACTNLQEVVFEEGSQITEIKAKSFAYCPKLKSVVLPETVTAIGDNAFGNKTTRHGYNWVDIDDPAYGDSDTTHGVFDEMTWTETLFYNDQLESVNIPNVTTIGESAFEGTAKINFVGGYPQGITSLGANAFKGAGITEITVPAVLGTIGAGSFQNCANLTTVVIEEGITEIGANAFANCASLTSIEIPTSVAIIGDAAFENCSSLATIDIPRFVGVIGARAFANCPALANVTATDNEAYVVENGMLMDIDKKVIYACFNKNITDLVIPEGVKEIAYGAFANSAITSITFNEDLEIIGDNAFAGCTALQSVTLPNSATSIGNSVFQNCTALEEVNFSNNLRSIGNNAFQGTALKKIHIGENITSIGSQAFAGLTQLTELTFDLGGVEFLSMSWGVFSGCTALKSVVMPRRGSVLPSEAFYDCTSLESITFDVGNGVTRQGARYFSVEIGGYAFVNCTSLKSIHFPAHFGYVPTSITSTSRSADIGYNAFENCSSLESVTFEDPNTLRKMDSNVFLNCTSLKEFHFPASMDLSNTSLGTGLFEGCTSLTTVTMPKMIGQYAYGMFKNSGIKEVIIPEGAVTIGRYFFEGCTKLEKVVIPSSVTTIDARAFYGCTSLKTIVIPDSVTSLGSLNYGGEVFAGCTALTELVIPSSVRSMFANNFDGWTAEQTIKVKHVKAEIGTWTAGWNTGCNATFVWGYQPE